MSEMLFYQRVVPLNDQTHAALRMRPLTLFRFAAQANSVPILAGEFVECARHYPIIFAPGDGGVVPAVLLGLRDNENLFVGEDGVWDAPYVPAFVRRYPFVPAKAADGQQVVCIDEAAPCFGTKDGDLLFQDGKPTPALTHAMSFLGEFQSAAVSTEAMARKIDALGLLRSSDSLAQLNSGKQFRLSGLRVIDEAKLATLADADIVELFKSGALHMIYLHLQSLGNLGTLVDRLSTREGLPKRAPSAGRMH
jgi:hypothetical protein